MEERAVEAREVAGSTPAEGTLSNSLAVLVNSADTPVFQTGAAGSMPAGRSAAGLGYADPTSRPPIRGALTAWAPSL
jgi:hypothetical protein